MALLVVSTTQAQTPYKVLSFSATAGFRHDSIPDGIAAIQQLGATNNFTVDTTENATFFTPANLAQYKVVIFLNTTGDVLTNSAQESALQNFIRAGGGWVGIHSAADTEYGWPWYGSLMGAYFASHPAIQQATVKVADRVDPSTRMLPKRWVRTDEWYNFQSNPRSSVHVLATLDETTYSGGTLGYDHPIAWSHFYDGGRAWYTAGGHTRESYSEPLFRAHLLGGIEFAAGVKQADPGSTLDSNFQKVILDNATADPFELVVAPDGRVFYIERGGNVKIYNPQNSSITLAGHIDVEQQVEDGMLGITLDIGFATNHWIYLFYSPTTNSNQHVSRFTVNGNSLDMSSEKVLLRIPTIRGIGNHSAGSLFMHTNGDLYLSVGDNTDPFSSSGYAPLDEQPGRASWDSQKSASNENDLRGKILRIHPQADGTYTIPSGNLFPPGTPNTKPEIYVMGCRNPFRFAVDEASGWLYWGEVGPDAGADNASRGPKGYDEWNQARAAGNYGWPYFIGNNKPYLDYDFATGVSGPAFNPNAVINNSPNNTGPTNLPPAQSAWLWYPYDASPEFPELNGSGGRTAMGGPVYHYQTNGLAARLPQYYDNTLFIWEWSRNYIKEVKLDDDGSVLKINPFLPSFSFIRPMDFKIGPDGVIYMIEWGTGFGGGNPDAKLVRIDYVGGNHAPVAVARATPDNGSVPLTVQFSSAGTYDQDTNEVFSLAWSFFGNGVTNSTAASPVFTYTNAGNYQAQLMVTDSGGNRTVANVSISVGNNKPVVTIQQPPNGAIFDWGKALSFQVSASDIEDGSTGGGSIACSNLVVAPLLGHNDHAHGQAIFNGCTGAFMVPTNTDSDSDNLFFALNASYTDRGAPSVLPLSTTTSYVFQPRRKQAEFWTTNSGVATALTADPLGGGLDVNNIHHGDFIGLWPVNLTNLNGIIFRVASSGLGGRIETRLDSPTGTLLATAYVPFTAGAYTNLPVSFSPPAGTHTLFFVFARNPGDANLLVLNWFEFQGPGISFGPTPFGGIARALPGTVQAEDFDNGGEGVAYHDVEPANFGGEYRPTTAVDIQTTTDTGAGYNVGWMAAGEWLNYTVNPTTPGVYALSLRVASADGGGSIHLEFGGVNKTGPITISDTGGWQTWQTITISNIALDPGPQIMRVVMDSSVGAYILNLNFLQATLLVSNSPPTVSLTSPPDQATYSFDTPIPLSATASDPGGSIVKVEFLANGNIIGTDTSAPYSISWSNISAGTYVVVARATDNLGNTTTSPSRTISVVDAEAPFKGFPQTIPGTIQAEDFDGGGVNVAYADNDIPNNGNQFRSTRVDIETTSDAGGGFNVGWTGGGEWLKYSLNAAVDGRYTLQARIASSGGGGSFHFEIDGVNKSGSLTNSDSGGWQTWRTVSVSNVGISSGPHIVRLVLDNSGSNGTVGNFNYFTFIATATNLPTTLVHRYSFEGSPGASLVADSIGNADGTALGGVGFTGDGKLNLLGSSGYVNLPNALISTLTNITVEAWLTWNGPASSSWQRIFDFGNNSGGENNQGTGLRYLALTPRSGNNALQFAATTNSGGGESPIIWTNALPTGQQTHVAANYNFLANTSVLYVNGQRVASGVAPFPLSAITDVNVWLGKSQWPDPYFNGVFDELRMYNGPLSDATVAASFATGPDALFTSLPRLGAARSGNAIILSWPLSAPGFALEGATSIQANTTWSLLTHLLVISNQQHFVTIFPTNATQFFRLRK